MLVIGGCYGLAVEGELELPKVRPYITEGSGGKADHSKNDRMNEYFVWSVDGWSREVETHSGVGHV